ncbi:MAG: glutathione peroxidase [Bacteroidota bacterium]|jgi:glutathione peroxidase
MKKIVSAFTVVFCMMSFTTQQGAKVPTKFYELSIGALDGKSVIHFSAFKGKKVLLVNTASECGYTPQLGELQKLADKYKDKLVVIGFPCNQFGGQEPGTPQRIQEFCSRRYAVTFQLTEKIDVKGEQQNTVYQWLTQKKYNKTEDVNVRWNFGKFLIDETGKFVTYFPSGVSPLDEQLTSLIEVAK